MKTPVKARKDDREPEAAQRPVPPVQREARRPRRGARDQNDVQLGSSQPFPVRSGPRRRRGSASQTAMVRSPQLLQRVLRSDATLAAWASRRDREEALAGIVRRHLPRPLALRIRVADDRNGQLELVADAGAVAAVVRQRSADLLAALRREGWEFTGIRVRVQVRFDPAPTRKPLANPLDRSSLRPLTALARSLPPGPLKAALDRFLRRAG